MPQSHKDTKFHKESNFSDSLCLCAFVAKNNRFKVSSIKNLQK